MARVKGRKSTYRELAYTRGKRQHLDAPEFATHGARPTLFQIPAKYQIEARDVSARGVAEAGAWMGRQYQHRHR